IGTRRKGLAQSWRLANRKRPDVRIMVGVLVVRGGDPAGKIRRILLGRLVAWQHRECCEPAQAAFDAVLVLWRDFLRVIERAGRWGDGPPLDVAEGQWRPAIPAKPPLGLV